MPWNQEGIAALIEMIIALFVAANLDDGEADAVVEILLPKLWRRPGLDLLSFRDMVAAMLPGDSPHDRDGLVPDWAPHSARQ